MLFRSLLLLRSSSTSARCCGCKGWRYRLGEFECQTEVELGSFFLERHLGGGSQPSDIQGQVKGNPQAGEGSGVCLTYYVRPHLRYAACCCILRLLCSKWFCPRFRAAAMRISSSVVEREGPNCVFSSFSEVFSAFTRDLYVISYLMESFLILCTSISCPFSGAPCAKKNSDFVHECQNICVL